MPNLRRILVTLAAVLGLTVTMAQPAQAACNWTGCATVSNLRWSDASILVARTYYSSTYNPTAKRLYPGQNSRRYWNDVNAFWIPTGCKAFNNRSGGWFYGGRWYRVGTMSWSLNVRC